MILMFWFGVGPVCFLKDAVWLAFKPTIERINH